MDPEVEPPAWSVPHDESARLEATLPAADRLDRRCRAVSLAESAADELPPRSQAFAAVLCRASSWVIDTDRERSDEVYLRYLREGPRYDGASDFGRRCPEPDWAGAAVLARRSAPRPALRWREAGVGAAAAAALAALLGVSWWRRSR